MCFVELVELSNLVEKLWIKIDWLKRYGRFYFTNFFEKSQKFITPPPPCIRQGRVPFGTHRYILHAFSNRPPLEVSFSRRFIKFCAQITNSNKPEVLHLYHKQKYDLRSTFGRNFSNIILNKKNYYLNYTCPVGDEWKIPMIKELLEIKNNNRTLDFFTTMGPDSKKFMVSRPQIYAPVP